MMADTPVERLSEPEVITGQLLEVVEPDGQDFLIARIAGLLVELPKCLSESLQSMMGQKVIVGRILGIYRAELSTQ
jgi:hypothetical protein